MILGYLDAGTGSLLLQAVLGGVAGIALFFRVRFRRFKAGDAAEETELEEST